MSFDGGAPKRGMGTGAKVLIILGVVAGLGMLVCCGGAGYLTYRARPKITEDPAEVAARTSAIIPMEIDREKWEPVRSFEQDVMVMSWSVSQWKAKEGEGAMMILGVEMPQGAADEEGAEDQIKQAFANNPEISSMPDLIVDKSEERPLKILGQEVPFRFVQGKRSGADAEWREVEGKIVRGNSLIAVRVQVEADKYNEDDIVNMLQSAK